MDICIYTKTLEKANLINWVTLCPIEANCSKINGKGNIAVFQVFIDTKFCASFSPIIFYNITDIGIYFKIVGVCVFFFLSVRLFLLDVAMKSTFYTVVA